jgi:hypothetical protein
VWTGIRPHEQDVGLPSKWGFLFAFNLKGSAQIIDYVLCNIKTEFSCAG